MPTQLALFTVTLLLAGNFCLLVERAPDRARWPGYWTGLGGQVEPAELVDLERAARREVSEETGLPMESISPLILRRVLLQHRPGTSAITLLLYFTGEVREPFTVSPGREGTLHWVPQTQLPEHRLIDNARLVLPLLLADHQRDPRGQQPVRLGIAQCLPNGEVAEILWAAG